MLARIEAPHFVCGIVLRGSAVVEAAPIVRYMIGWQARKVRSYCDGKGWRIARVIWQEHKQ